MKSEYFLATLNVLLNIRDDKLLEFIAHIVKFEMI